MKEKSTAYLLLFFLGGLAAHLFYLKKYKRAILFLCTGGLLGVGYLYDWFTLSKQVEEYNESLGYGHRTLTPEPIPQEFYN